VDRYSRSRIEELHQGSTSRGNTPGEIRPDGTAQADKVRQRSVTFARIRLKRYPRVILYEAGNLQKRIKPGSNVHPGVDLEDEWDGEQHLEPVRSAVMQARDLLERLEDPEAPTNEFVMAWNGIMPSRLRERKRQ
jgi:hypothetical protein